MDKQVRMFAGKVKSVNEKDFTVLATVSDETIDRSGEVIQVSAWVNRLENYKKHPILLSSHNYYGLLNQIGMAKELMIGDSFDVEFKYFVGEGNPEADWAFNLAKKGIVAFSVGFYPKAWVDGDRESGVRRTYTDAKWDGAGARKRLFALSGEDFNKYAKGFAWFDDDNKGTQAAYKLPHHDVVGEAIQTNWKGVASAMAALLGARGGTDIPEDRESIVKEVKTLIQGELGHQGQKQEENHIALILQGVKDISQTLA